MCEVTLPGGPPTLISVIYRPPRVAFTRNPHLLEALRSNIFDFSHKVIMGDLNADLSSDSDDSRFVRRLLDELSLQLVQHGPTHHTSSSSTWLDVIALDDNSSLISYSNTHAPFPSKHNIITACSNIGTEPDLPPTSFSYRDYKNIDADIFSKTLRESNWDAFNTLTNIDDAVQQLNDNLSGAIDIHAPLRSVTPRRGRLPWVDAEIAGLYKRRDAVYRRYCRTKGDSLLEEFFRLRDLAASRTTEARTNYYHHKINSAIATNSVWKQLRNLGLLPVRSEDLNGFSPDALNSHFASVSVSNAADSSLFQEVFDSAPKEGFKFHEVEFDAVARAVAHFASDAAGEDGIPHSVIVKSLGAIGGKLVELFNASLRTGSFPVLWGRARIVPLKKKACPSSASDFRPIALLCFLSKVLEKIVHEQIMDFLLVNNILDHRQAGFRPNHSTQTALLRLTDDIRTGIDKKLLTLLIQFDFSKAFDRISHLRLLRRLRDVGFSEGALRWIGSYLTSREQAVVTRQAGTSSWLTTHAGVPQGSVLGPLLFCLYINDIPDALTPGTIKHLLYADDLQIYVQVPWGELDAGVAALERASAGVAEWAREASLVLNAGKTGAIVFGAQRYIKQLRDLSHPGINVDGVQIPFRDTVTSLGVVLDCTLSWRPHIDYVTKKFNQALFRLRSFRQYTTTELRRGLAMALLFPHLDYCSVVYLDASQELRKRLQVMLNSGVRYVLGIRRDEHVTPHRVELGWMRTDTRRQYFLAVTMYKVLRLHEPAYLVSLFTRCAPRTTSRGVAKELAVPSMRTETGLRSFQVQGARLWNSLPSEMRTLPSLLSFKAAVRRHLQTLD